MHQSVLREELLYWLQPKSGGVYVDGTVGEGGHSEAILEASAPDARVIGFDRDPNAVAAARERLGIFGARVIIKHDDYRNATRILGEMSLDKIDGAVLDLGVSSRQLDTAARGFSFLNNGPLDMRMNTEDSATAADLVNRLPEAELARIIYEFGEERYSRRIARAIVRRRQSDPILTTQALVDVIRGSVPTPYLYGRLHFATRTFQALRITVNRELEGLDASLKSLAVLLAPGGRLAVIAFHSLEDRIVKHTYRDMASGPLGYRVLTKRPIVPSADECASNPRARSAKLRVIEKEAAA